MLSSLMFMARPFDVKDLPEDIARAAQAQVATGRFATVEEAIRAGLDALADEAAEIEAADGMAWQAYQARHPTDPRDMSAAEVLACLDTEDPDKQQAVSAHLDALVDDIRAGRGMPGTTAEMMADIRARLGLRQRS
jgi:Arc/MetJ-type ribon-helix-helix transcriptional regulator